MPSTYQKKHLDDGSINPNWKPRNPTWKKQPSGASGKHKNRDPKRWRGEKKNKFEVCRLGVFSDRGKAWLYIYNFFY